MSDFPKLSGKEIVILDLLINHGEMYGLEMVKASSELKRGAIYVTLSRMADKGYVKSRTIEDPTISGKPRRLYSATGEGQRVFESSHVARISNGLSFGEGFA